MSQNKKNAGVWHKRVLCICLSLVLVFGFALTCVATAVSGDLSGDGKITAFDAQMLAEYQAGLRTLTAEQLVQACGWTVRNLINTILGNEAYADRHAYSDWVETIAPNCTETGEERRECNDCGYVQTQEIAASGHDVVHHDAQEATCTAFGWSAYVTCSRCDYTTYVQIPETGHSYGQWQVVSDPTTTSEGQMIKVCQSDSSHLETFVLPELRTTNGYTYEIITPATNTTNGLGRYTFVKDEKTYCFDVVIFSNETEFDPR